MKDKALSVKVELSRNNSTRGGHILHEQKYNTGHGIQAIPNEICSKIRREPGKPEIQQNPVIHLLLARSLGWKRGLSGLSIPASPQPSQPAYGGRAEADPGYAPQKSEAWHGGVVAPLETAWLYPPSGKFVSGHAKIGAVSR